ncbi:hypothetical protein BHF71_04765 [Vulcanibacillus modesticaldus]|uniref:AraC family transcriptional regulator n=1 Tax=Vulcanibacillus modesticaldus TaxID=337097 RepID=A0A1D2YRQ6_9BACI|nr:CD1247 N-terminal domain-containing protein [Vulcanibacillus modesticaldus]OEF95507.1 hypothetical protein BHF71_04765 [Vulcanibacillus modesticaldus]
MDRISERISYLEGLADGLDIYDRKEGKVFEEIIGILSDLNNSLKITKDRIIDLEDYINIMDEDLNELENDYYEYDDFEEDYDDDVEIDEDDVGIGYYRVECPNCHDTIMVDHELFEYDEPTEVVCPNCHESIIIDSDDINDAEDDVEG